jgi:F0F1-type ATP synthase epsilon subunit
MADTLQVEIVTPEHMVINDQASELTMPGKNGYLMATWAFCRDTLP